MSKISTAQVRAATELIRRQQDGVEMFRPLPHQEDIVRDEASEILVRGGNRSGKSTISAVKFAAVARDRAITLNDGTVVDQRLPHQKGRPLTMWIIGLQLNHIGQTIHRLLFRPGLYRIIRDETNGLWRAYDPDSDADRESEARQSFSLIPPWEVETWEWERKPSKQFTLCRLKNGTEIYAYASTADVKQGDPVDYIWIDERIANSDHYPEWQARLSDRKGRIVWSSMPRVGISAMSNLSERAQDQAEEVEKGLRKKADVTEYKLRFSSNPHIDEEQKRLRLEGWSEEERLMRDEGEFQTGAFLIYPTFSRQVHAAIYEDSSMDDIISSTLRERSGQPPSNWTRDLILDPGTAKPAVLFCAVPPPSFGDYLVVYDEIYIPRLDADQLAEKVKQKASGYHFERFIIDNQAGRQSPMGFGISVASNYTRAFREAGLSCRQTGSSFSIGSPDVEGRIGRVLSAMHVRRDGKPRLRIVLANCPNLVKQIEGNVKAMDKEVVTDKPARGQKDDLRCCLEYWISRDPVYVVPPETSVKESPALRYFNMKQKMRAGREEPGRITVGPPSGDDQDAFA